MDKKDNLTQVVENVQAGKEQFEKLYSLIVNKIYFWCFTIIKNEENAKDATQEIILLIYKKVKTVKHPEYFRSWMYRITRNYCINYMRKNRHEVEFYRDDEYSESSEAMIKEQRAEFIPHESFESNETKELIRSFIERLPEKQREVVILFYLEEYKISEISQILDYNEGSIKSRLHSARKNLESMITEYNKKTNSKLYSVAILPMLGILLKEYQDEVCAKQDLKFNKKYLKPTKTPKKIGIISTVTLSVASLVLLISLNLPNKGFSEEAVDKMGWVSISENDIDQHGNTSITYIFKVKKGPLTALHAHVYWDKEEMQFNKTENKNIDDWVEEDGHIILMNDISTESNECSITLYFKNVDRKFNQKLPIYLEFEDETSKYEPERTLVTLSGGDYEALELIEVDIPEQIYWDK